MLDERFAQRLAEIERIVESDAEVEDQVREAGSDFASYVLADPQWQRLFFEFAAYAARHEDFRRELVKRYALLRDRIADVYRRRIERLGITAPVPVEQVSVMTFAMANGVALEALLEPEAVSEDLFSTMLTVFFTGLGELDRTHLLDSPRRAERSAEGRTRLRPWRWGSQVACSRGRHGRACPSGRWSATRCLRRRSIPPSARRSTRPIETGRFPMRIAAGDLILIGVATHKLSRLLTKEAGHRLRPDAVHPLRGPRRQGGGQRGAPGPRVAPRDRRAADLPLLHRPVDSRRIHGRQNVRPAPHESGQRHVHSPGDLGRPAHGISWRESRRRSSVQDLGRRLIPSRRTLQNGLISGVISGLKRRQSASAVSNRYAGQGQRKTWLGKEGVCGASRVISGAIRAPRAPSHRRGLPKAPHGCPRKTTWSKGARTRAAMARRARSGPLRAFRVTRDGLDTPPESIGIFGTLWGPQSFNRSAGVRARHR